MDKSAAINLKLALAKASNTPEELHFLIESLCVQQRELLVSLLTEERENIEPFVEENTLSCN